MTELPLFPLPVVLFPGAHLPLKIFEQRYIDMVRECSVKNSCFGVCLINKAHDPQKHTSHMRYGTTAKICDWSTLDNGLLGIITRGTDIFIVQSTRMRDNGLMIGEVKILTDPGPVEVPVKYSVLSVIAGRFMDKLGENYPSYTPQNLQDSYWVSCRLAELLPLENHEKQMLLQLSDPLERLQFLLEAIPRFQSGAP